MKQWGSAINSSADQTTRYESRQKWLWSATVLALIGAAVYWWNRPEEVQVPVPADLAHLDPQVRDLVRDELQALNGKSINSTDLTKLGSIYAGNLLWVEASQCFSNVVRLKPEEPLAYVYLAISAQETGRFQEALRIFRHVTVSFPNFPQGWDRLGSALLKNGELEQGEKAYQQLMRLAPGEWRGYSGVGEARLRLNDFAQAAKYLEQALKIEAGARLAHHLLGLAYRGLGRAEDAAWEMRLGLNAEQTPMPDEWGNAAAGYVRLLPQQIELATHLMNAGRSQEAIKILRQLLEYHPHSSSLMENLALAYRNANQPQTAHLTLQEVLKTSPNSLGARILMVEVCLDLGLIDEARLQAEQASELGPDMPQVYLAKAEVLFALGRNSEALAARLEAFRHDPQNPMIALDIGDAYLEVAGDAVRAKEFFRRALLLDPTLGFGYMRLAKVDLRLRELDEARECINKLRKLGVPANEISALETDLNNLRNGK